MDRETLLVLNDLLDIVDKLTEIVSELNPGAQNQLGLVEFIMARVERTLDGVQKSLDHKTA
jgi:hypothetical protein